MGRPRELTEEQRQHLLSEGFVPIEVWIRDPADESYRAEARRQAASAAAADVEDRVMEWLEAVSAEAWDDL